MVVEVNKENAELCVKLLVDMFNALSKHDRPRFIANAALIETFVRAAGGCDDATLIETFERATQGIAHGEETKTAQPEPGTRGAGEAEPIDPAASVSRKRR
jgi:hypothetical protein